MKIIQRWEPFSGSASCEGNILGTYGKCHEAAVAIFEVGGFRLAACGRCLPSGPEAENGDEGSNCAPGQQGPLASKGGSGRRCEVPDCLNLVASDGRCGGHQGWSPAHDRMAGKASASAGGAR